jgi:hypothetical protein
MSPPPIEIKSNEGIVHSHAQEEVQEALDFVRQLAKEPFRLTQEQRERITSGVLSKMGHHR